MANKKFSQFDLKTNSADVQFVVGYNGTDNVRIAPSNLGGGGASDLNGLSDVSIDLTNDNAFFINIPSGISGAVGNIGIGKEALNSLTSGDYNTAIGKQALNNSTTSERSTAIGYNAGASAGTNLQLNAVLIGDNAGFGRSGYRTVAVGSGAMSFGLGKSAVNRNTAIGYHALYRIDTNGADNIAIGHEASQFLTTATTNIAIGDNAARSSTANGHISIGYQAGFSQTSGSNNTNVGYKSGYANTTGGFNVTLGYEAGRNNTGSHNTYLGFEAGRAKTSGNDNTVVGFRALDAETTGQRNTAIGYEALGSQDQTAASHNTAVGWQADDGNTNGYYRTNIGASTGRGSATGANITNIGYSAIESSSSASNEVTLGNSSVATLRCAVTSITSLSDERDKSEIKDLGYGLAFIDALQPREFVWDNRPETDADGEEFYSANKGKKDFGFIAQEVQELDNDTLRLVYDSNPDKLELSYGKLVPILVQAIKELKAEVELLKS
jgi:hypothetical protein